MSNIVNRRNAVLGWAVWTMARREAKRRAKKAVHADSGGSGRGRIAALVLGALSAVGLVFVWRWRRGGGADETPVLEPVEAPRVDVSEPTPLGALQDDDIPPAA